MSKTLAPSVTARDRKGRKFISVVEAAYNNAGLNDQEAQRVNDTPGLADLIGNFIAEHRHEVPPILKQVAKGIKAAGSKRFVADQASLKEANIGWTGGNFDQYFLGKVEENVKDAVLAVYRLEENALDAPIRKELGQGREEITLAHFFGLIKKQSKGQKGNLLVNGYANIAYLRDKNGTLWAVHCSWNSDRGCWRVEAYSVENPCRWGAGRRVFSRD